MWTRLYRHRLYRYLIAGSVLVLVGIPLVFFVLTGLQGLGLAPS